MNSWCLLYSAFLLAPGILAWILEIKKERKKGLYGQAAIPFQWIPTWSPSKG